MKAHRIVTIGFIASVAACAAGPNYHVPKTDAPPAFIAQVMTESATATATSPSVSTVDLTTWWRALDDVELNALVDRAVKSNLDLEMALDRLQQARTYEAVVLGAALPEVDGSAAAGRGTGSDLTKGRADQVFDYSECC